VVDRARQMSRALYEYIPQCACVNGVWDTSQSLFLPLRYSTRLLIVPRQSFASSPRAVSLGFCSRSAVKPRRHLCIESKASTSTLAANYGYCKADMQMYIWTACWHIQSKTTRKRPGFGTCSFLPHTSESRELFQAVMV
jgi:hypothetical protein